jgi:hypothetical protein
VVILSSEEVKKEVKKKKFQTQEIKKKRTKLVFCNFLVCLWMHGQNMERH